MDATSSEWRAEPETDLRPARIGRTTWIWLLWGLVLTAAVVTTVLFLVTGSSAGAAGDCGGG